MFPFLGRANEVLMDSFVADTRNAQLSRKFKLYYRLRPFIPLLLRQLLQRKRNSGMEVPDAWYIPQDFIEQFSDGIALDLAEFGDQTIIHPWPERKNFATVLTHDVETAQGFHKIDHLARMEESLGFRSSWHIVPHKYPVDVGLLKDLVDRGHEIGVHGYNHDGKLFTSKGIFDRRATKINDALLEYGATGFRAPMVHRNLDWICELRIQHDASCFDIDPFQAMPGGVGSIWPFIVNDVVELPYTLPQDHTLFVALGQESVDPWLEKLAFIRRWSGMALVLTHPDYLDTQNRLDLYERFLDHLNMLDDHWRALPAEVTRWWRHRSQSKIAQDGSIAGPAAEAGWATSYRSLFGGNLPN